MLNLQRDYVKHLGAVKALKVPAHLLPHSAGVKS